MKTITLGNHSIQTSDKSFEALKKSLIKEERWVPKKGVEYYVIDSYGDTAIYNWGTYKDSDLFRLGQNNVFKTKDEAENHAKKLHAISKITNYCWDNGLAKEWVGRENNWFFYWNPDIEAFANTDDEEYKTLQVLPYLKSGEACDEVIEKFEDELKLIFEV